MKPTQMAIYISNSQLLIYHEKLDNPFHFWTKEHSQQGFSWLPESAAFRTVGGDGTALVEFSVVDDFLPIVDAVRVIDVPFVVPAGAPIEIGSVAGGNVICVPAGAYQLRFEDHGTASNGSRNIKFYFKRCSNASFGIVRADSELAVPRNLLLTGAFV